LEDLENGKLITSRDVQFHEDATPSELATIDLKQSSPEEIDNLIDTAVYPDPTSARRISIPSTSSESEIASSLLEPDSPRNSPDESSTVEDLQYPTPSRSTTPIQSNSPVEMPQAPRKASKWENLPKRAPSSRNRRLPERYRQEDQSDEVSTHAAFVAVN
ncbi:hypothetical protein C0993_004099, partial [Termitomyces sp. T159_Od127]